MSLVRFDKFQGLGNDFVVIEAEETDLPAAEWVRTLCDRHFGVGADGVLCVGKGQSAGTSARMIVINADGTRPEMCGNGIRCVGLFLAQRANLARARYLIDTDAGVRICDVERDGERGTVEVSLGRGEILGRHEASFDGRKFVFTRVSMGNPHAVVFDADLDVRAIDAIAPEISRQLGGANIGFCRAGSSGDFELCVWERGVGRTLACGTGAAAAAVAATHSGRAPFDTVLPMRLPGGTLNVSVEAGTLKTQTKGPAVRVYTGQLSA